MSMFVFAARVWHYWIAVALMIPAILLVLAVAAGYVVKVVRPKYPKQ
jgi:hypothetical protein